MIYNKPKHHLRSKGVKKVRALGDVMGKGVAASFSETC